MKKESHILYILLAILMVVLTATIALAIQLDKSPDMQSAVPDEYRFNTKLEITEILTASSELLNTNEFVKAENLLNHSIKQYPANIDLWLLLGTAYFRQEKFEQAEKAFRHVIRHKPDSAAGFNNLGESLIKLKRFNEAQAAIGNALRLSPNRGEILLNAASLYALMQEDKQALKFLKQAMANGIRPEEISEYSELVRLLERPEFMNYYNRKRSEQKNRQL